MTDVKVALAEIKVEMRSRHDEMRALKRLLYALIGIVLSALATAVIYLAEGNRFWLTAADARAMLYHHEMTMHNGAHPVPPDAAHGQRQGLPW